jgi:7,8-dihydroneopterin aldolase/epimerase/oxygenase
VRGVEIEIRGLSVFAYHGVHPEEREQGQTFVIDVWLECAPSRAAETDELADAVDYSAVCDRIVELATGGPYRLLERLSALIADDLVDRHGVARARVRIAKPEAPIRHSLTEVAVVAEASAEPNSGV